MNRVHRNLIGQENNSRLCEQRLLLSGDVELNPGPPEESKERKVDFEKEIHFLVLLYILYHEIDLVPFYEKSTLANYIKCDKLNAIRTWGYLIIFVH